MKKYFVSTMHLSLLVLLMLLFSGYSDARTEETTETSTGETIEASAITSTSELKEDKTKESSDGLKEIVESSSEPDSQSEYAPNETTETSKTASEEKTEETKEAKETFSETATRADIKSGTWGDVSWTFSGGSLTFTSGGNLGESKDSPWRKNYIVSSEVSSITFNEKVYTPEDSSNLFSGSNENRGFEDHEKDTLYNCTTINGTNHLDTSKTTNMAYMFSNMFNLKSLDLSSFDTSNVKNMSLMFYCTWSLKDINVRSFDTANVTTMWAMFNGSAINELDIKNFDTKNVQSFQYMFSGAMNITELNLSNFKAVSLTDARCMFKDMINLTTLNISDMEMSSVLDTECMFENDCKLSSLTINTRFKQGNGNRSLPQISGDTTIYTGNWINAETKKSVGTSDEFLNNATNIEKGTYVWEKRKTLNLDKVPGSYAFSTKLHYDGNYELTNGTISPDNAITVTGYSSNKGWSVKASIVGEQLTLNRGEGDVRTFKVTSFKINEDELVAQGSIAVVSSDDAKGVDTYTKPVTKIAIKFSDDEGILKVDDQLEGTIRYELCNTSAVNLE